MEKDLRPVRRAAAAGRRDRNHTLRRRYERLRREHEQTRQIAEHLAREAVAHRAAAPRDPLTGLANRGELERRVDRLLERGSRGFAVLLLDLDRFKEVNDTLGHLAGDTLLRELAARLERSLDPAATSARFGGDEFAVVLPRRARRPGRIRPGDGDPACAGTTGFRRRPPASSSMRASAWPSRPTTVEKQPPCCTAPMSRCTRPKRARRGVARYDAADDPRSDAHLAFAAAPHEAITTGAIVVHYQPIAAALTAPWCGSRRSRWRHADLGLIEPSEFILGAEQSGLIGRLTEYVLDRAFATRTTGGRTGTEVSASQSTWRPRTSSTAASLLGSPPLLAAQRVPAGNVTLELREASVPTLEGARHRARRSRRARRAPLDRRLRPATVVAHPAARPPRATR